MRRQLITALLFLGLVSMGKCCMVGYEAERDRLKENLGIEWAPHGLDKNDFSDTKTIRHSSDLDCTFSEPETCKWKNMDEKHGLDSLDFHLFEKTDFTEFPALRVGPGPTNVPQGDKMIFTGDRKREEQHAIFYSSLIGCQNTTGNLTFTYWVYNGARVEVLLLEDKVGGGYIVANEKPYVDCGLVQMNTECHAEIPPREKPFRLGIRAYSISNMEGSFVMLNHIIYNAGLCKVAVDLGDEFRSFSLVSSAEGKNIHTSTDLDCAHFDERCKWRASGDILMQGWRRSSSELPKSFLLNTTGNDIGPKGTYAVLYIEQDAKVPLDYLRSDPIACQSQTENEFSFRFWASREIELEVCAVGTSEGKDVECLDVPMAMSPAPVKLSFKKATTNFMIAVRVKSFNKDFDSVVIVDDITYKATLCSDAISVFDLGENFLTTPLLSLLLARHVNSAKELACDFSKRASDCVWGSADSDNQNSELEGNSWSVGHGPLNEEKFYSLTMQSDMPEGEFAVARLETGGSALLLSEFIRCVVDRVSIQFNLWTTGTATLQVCLVEDSTHSLLDCQTAQPGPVVVDLPSIKRPFRIALRAEAEDQGLVLVDNIDVQGDVCPSSLRQFSSKTLRIGQDQPDPNVCRLLSCNFKLSHPCLYETSPIPNGAQHQMEQHHLVSYLYAGQNVSILESPPFKLNTVSRLHFQYNIQNGVALFVCNDSANKELESCFKVDGTQGKDYIELLPSDTKVYLIARLANGASGKLTLSNLQLTDVADNNAC